MVKSFEDFVAEGVIGDMVRRSAGKRIRREDIGVVAGCANDHYFVDGNGKEPEFGFLPQDRYQLRELLDELLKVRGNDGDFNDIDTSNITDMVGVFNKKFDFNGDISGWDVSNVESFSYMFYDAKSFNRDISGWDTSNAVLMDSMFARTDSFDQDISGWDVSKVKSFCRMFAQAKAFNQDLSRWKKINPKFYNATRVSFVKK